MGTEVLRPQDLLVERFHVTPPSFHRRRNFPANGALPNLNVNRKPNHTANSNNRKTSPKPEKKKSNAAGQGEARRKHEGGANGGHAVGQITLLRRGESLDSLITTSKTKGGNAEAKSLKPKPVDDLAVLGVGRIGPESPEMLPKQIRLSPPPLPNMYAGSVCDTSPSPQSLPLPSFFSKKLQINSSNDPATRDLRRMLRLD